MEELDRFVVDRGGALVTDFVGADDVGGGEGEAGGVCVVGGLDDA
ncbi:hypothetical protein [Amycolatopsis vastitatis]|nr:hypothetical protein [Amycolatopsis vastitatis]